MAGKIFLISVLLPLPETPVINVERQRKADINILLFSSTLAFEGNL
jgi:hypothetical protein